MLIRKAYITDIPLIRKMAFEIWPVAYGHILAKDQLDYMLDRLYSQKVLQEQMEGNVEFVMACDGDDPVGFASFELTTPGVCKLHKLYVLSSQQGKGTGRFIIDELSKKIKANGVITLQLNVNRYNKARHFYEKLGFTVIREEDVDIGNGYYMNDYVMEKSLLTGS